MDVIVSILEAAAKAGPLVISLLTLAGSGYIIYVMQNKVKDYDEKYETITGNHLHEMPQIAASLKSVEESMERIATSLDRQERLMVAMDAYVRARLNGHGNK